jgi:hypothetical protein
MLRFLGPTSVLRLYLNKLAQKWDVTQAVAQYSLFEKAVAPAFGRSDIDAKMRLQLLELIGLCKIDISIHALKCVMAFEPEKAVKQLGGVVDGKGKVPEDGVPNSVRSTVDNLAKLIKFERQVEGRRLSPEWYVEQIIARGYAAEIKRIYSALVGSIEVAPGTGKGIDEALEVALRKQREVELANRLEAARGHYSDKVVRLVKYQRLSDLPIETMPDDYECERLVELRSIQLNSLADVLVPLYQPTRDEAAPDFFGISFRQLVLELFNRLKKNDLAGFRELFPKVFLGAFLAKERLASELSGHPDEMAKVRITCEPIVDVLHLSGYAAAFADLHGNADFFKSAMSCWKGLSRVLKGLDTPQKILGFIVTIHGLQRADFRMTATSHLRFAWKQSFENVLREKRLIYPDRFGFGSRTDEGELVVPKFPLLKAICDGGREPYEDPTEWFIVAFLAAEGLDERGMDLSSVSFLRDFRRANEDEDESQ